MFGPSFEKVDGLAEAIERTIGLLAGGFVRVEEDEAVAVVAPEGDWDACAFSINASISLPG
jgi:hypothetical protein